MEPAEQELAATKLHLQAYQTKALKLLEEREGYRRLAHDLGVRCGWLSPSDGTSWKVLDDAWRNLMEQARSPVAR